MTSVIESDDSVFRDCLGRSAFSFGHRLADHPLFDLDRLARLAEKVVHGPYAGKSILLDAHNAEAQTKFSTMAAYDLQGDTITEIERAALWLKLSSVEKSDKDYADLLQSILCDIEALSGVPLRCEITWSGMTIVVSSPGITTPYHIDHEYNFLLQIRGEKNVNLLDGADREILSAREIEAFYVNDFDAPSFRDESRVKSRCFHLAPGIGVHQPPLAPHWVQNCENLSISVSIMFCTRELNARAKVFQANHFLRSLGFAPLEPSASPLSDRLKTFSLGLLSKHRPKDYHEMLYSGVERLQAPVKFARRLRHRQPTSP
ncbi:MAG TPA: hypothetical protein VKS22_10925 [Candidatus Binataceae bacterium]|nr:hypothetical protein [Candidatus Binataceae bacterium]